MSRVSQDLGGQSECNRTIELCRRCLDLELDRLVTPLRPFSAEPGLSSAKPRRARVDFSNSTADSLCALCRLFDWAAAPVRTLKKYDLRVKSLHLGRIEGDALELHPGYGGVLGRSIIPIPWRDQSNKLFPEEALAANLGLLKEWIEECETSHGHCRYTNRSRNNKLSISVIDCKSRRICTVPPGRKYLALSYAWGNVPADEVSDTERLPSKLSPLIEDTIPVTTGIRLRYC